jgi:GH24 family phage-related lysozyme (muramidase)
MKISKISEANKNDRQKSPPMPHNFGVSKNPIVLEILEGKDWYSRYLKSQNIYQNIYQEAGMKENIVGGLLGALMLVLSGITIQEVSKQMNIPEAEIEEAVMDPSQVEYAKNVMRDMEEEKEVAPSVDPFIKEAFDYIGDNEGLELEVYKDSKGIPTIGVGHKIRPGEDFSGGITREEALRLFSEDLQERLSVTKSLFPAFDSYPNSVKVALLDGVFRGDHKRSYRTTKLINAGNWIEASKEYLRHNDYYESLKEKTGVAGRMEGNAKRMYDYGKQLQKTQP